MAEDVDAARLCCGLQGPVFGYPLPQLELIHGPVQPVLQVCLVGLESLAGFVHRATPAAEVCFAAVH